MVECALCPWTSRRLCDLQILHRVWERRRGVMFTVEVCEDRKVVLIRFHGQLTENDFAGLDKLASDTRGSPSFDCIFDMTSVEKVELSTNFVVKRGDLPQ